LNIRKALKKSRKLWPLPDGGCKVIIEGWGNSIDKKPFVFMVGGECENEYKGIGNSFEAAFRDAKLRKKFYKQ
jgi:hypothetical protein